ncbi:hypothetical protein Y1Q_0000090 [Alligator mississippiensis]|uniref:Uncharacterized protein n=1 Tax=Alligator mississippiensis TaxID=8496 RepID=A0A151NQG0_ALLMI|nr:hypothetical protein Y1Q_0000090 [Alligator mississippiensis]
MILEWKIYNRSGTETLPRPDSPQKYEEFGWGFLKKAGNCRKENDGLMVKPTEVPLETTEHLSGSGE